MHAEMQKVKIIKTTAAPSKPPLKSKHIRMENNYHTSLIIINIKYYSKRNTKGSVK